MNDFPDGIITRTAHRPWPLPGGPWLMTQSWHNLLFAHWPVDADLLRSRLPRGLPLDLFEGQAWIGIVPFRMTNVAPRFVPVMPFVSAFAELNVRTYVTVNGKPGVYFFSLDAESAIAVAAARSLLHLPYFPAQMEVRSEGQRIFYSSRRTSGDTPPAEWLAHYEPDGPRFEPLPGTLDHFLTERYCLYNVDAEFRVYRLEIHHPPWVLQKATARIDRNTMTDWLGIRIPAVAPRFHFSGRQDMVAWAPETLESIKPS